MYQFLLSCLDANEQQSLNNSINKALEIESAE
jgi:hypothetical protein